MSRISSRLGLLAALGLFATLAPAAHAQLFVAHDDDNVYQVSSTGTQTTYAASVSGAQYTINDLAFDVGGNLYVADANHNTIDKITPGGVKSTFAAFGQGSSPVGVAFDVGGNLFVADGSAARQIYKVTPSGNVSTFASGGLLGNSSALDIAFDSAGNLYTDLVNGDIIKVTPGGTQSLFAHQSNHAIQIAFDAANNLYTADVFNNTVSKITQGGTITTFATGFNNPAALAFDPSGNLYVGNNADNKIYKVDTLGNSTLFTTLTTLSNAYGPEFFTYRTPAAVPEPGSVALLVGLGVTGAGFARRRKSACRRKALQA